MKYIKFKAFTLAEVMVLLLVLSILMAAMAPVFTTRYNNAATDEVWSYVAGDDNNDAYFDAINKSYTAQAFIGVTPVNKLDVPLASADNSDNAVYSKVVIRASDRLNTGALQNQMQFRYGNSDAGALVGSLFAGNGNMLLGGIYDSIKSDAVENTAYGAEALSSLTSGDRNTAVGYKALNSLTTGSDNTAIGYYAGSKLTSGKSNTIVGYRAGENSTGSFNTLIGDMTGRSITGSQNTAIGNYSMQAATGASNNTAAGNYALNKLTSGDYNTAVGYNAAAAITSGSNNTAFGDNSCLSLTSGSNKTCIGASSGSPTEQKKPMSALFTGTTERVFIGSLPVQSVSSTTNLPAAVLEVHNLTTTNSKSKPLKGVGNESVVINGNLIVRGQSYFETYIYRRRQGSEIPDAQSNPNAPKGLVKYMLDNVGNNMYGFMAYDGAYRTNASYQGCRGCKQHAYSDKRKNCICTTVSGTSSNKVPANDEHGREGYYCTPGDTAYSGGTYSVSTSYDWSSESVGNMYGCSQNDVGRYYKDASFNCTVDLEANANIGGDNAGNRGSDYPLAHRNSNTNGSCCPNLKSDIRLKNVGDKFTAGLDELRKLNIYNYTFKNDSEKLPHVGVIAQDLKLIFPNAVSKDDRGYYQIRWDEMFYAAINSIKTLNTKIENLASKVANDRNRIASLKKDNAQLNARLDKLADEVAKLEVQKHK